MDWPAVNGRGLGNQGAARAGNPDRLSAQRFAATGNVTLLSGFDRESGPNSAEYEYAAEEVTLPREGHIWERVFWLAEILKCQAHKIAVNLKFIN